MPKAVEEIVTEKEMTLEEIVESLTLFDDTFMSLVFENNKEAVEFLLNTIFGKEDISVVYAIGQKHFKNADIRKRSVILDIYAKDDFRCTRAEDMYYDVLRKSVQYFKQTDGGKGKMSSLIKKYAKQEARKVAKQVEEEVTQRVTQQVTQKTRIDTLYADIRNIVEELGASIERAMDILKVSDADRAILMERF